jgi:hypothetical protein
LNPEWDWGQLEYIIDRKINEALALPGAPKINPKIMVPFNQRLELLDDLCKRFLVDHKNRQFAAKIIHDLKQLSSQRSLIVHGSVAYSKQRKNGRVVYWFRRICWDQTPRIAEKRALTTADVERFASKINDQLAPALLIEAFFWSVEGALLDKSQR